MNKKGFTLIELLAVIVILGVILVIAIPSISAAILNSRKNSFVATANEFVDGLRMMTLTDPTLLPSGTNQTCKDLSLIKLEKGSSTKSPFGKDYTNDSEVCVAYNSTTSEYDYKVCLIDTGGNRICDINDEEEYVAINIKDVTKESVIVGGSTPPEEPESEPEPPYGNDANTLLLLHAEDFINSSSTTNTITNTNVTLNTTVKKFGSSSFYFNGSNAYLDLSNLISFGSGNFTIDFWVYFLNNTKGYQGLIDNRNVNSDYNSWVVYMEQNNSFQFIASAGSGWTVIMPISSTVTLNTWYHIAVVRNGNNWYTFKDGVIVTTRTNNTTVISTPTSPIRIGTGKQGTYGLTSSCYFNGYMDEIRISNTARWTENFTPPIKAYN